MDSVLYDSPSSFLKHLTWSPLDHGEWGEKSDKGGRNNLPSRHFWRPASCPLGLCNLCKASAFLSLLLCSVIVSLWSNSLGAAAVHFFSGLITDSSFRPQEPLVPVASLCHWQFAKASNQTASWSPQRQMDLTRSLFSNVPTDDATHTLREYGKVCSPHNGGLWAAGKAS